MIVIQLGLFIKNKKINNVYIKSFLWLIPAIFMIQEALFVTRWQFVIAYVVAIFIFISIYFHHYHNLIQKRVLIGIYTFMIVLFIASLYVFPMTDIPNPSGDYQIGTYVETVEDMSREE
jgi:hypothetical protein